MKTFTTTAALLAAGLFPTAASAQVVLENGSFEQVGQLYSPALGGLFEASGWVNTSGLDIQASSALAGVEGTPAGSITGLRFLRLASDNADPQNTGSIYQDLGTILAGQSYALTGDAFGGDSINNLWGATISFTSDPLGQGTIFASTTIAGLARGATTSFSLDFAGTAATAGQSLYLRLVAAPSGPGQDIRGGVDNLQLAVAAVPEPATWGLMIAGVGAVGGALRRRKVTARVRFA